MKRLLKTAAIIFGAITFSANLFALDFGGLFKNNSRFGTQNFKSASLSQQDSITGWFKAPITPDEKLYFSMEADATFRYSKADLSNSYGIAEFIMDLSLLKLTYYTNLGNGILQVNAGRFATSDATSTIISQTADGLQASFSSNYVRAIVYGGYTGLTNSRYGSIIDGPSSDFTLNNNAIYQFNSPYALTGVSVALPYLFKNQTIGLEGYAILGIPGFSGDNSGDNRFYVTALMNGPIIKNLYYSLSSTVGICDGVSNLSKVAITYYPATMDTTIQANLLYASGENGFLKPFRAFTSEAASLAYSGPEYTGIFKAGLSLSIRPVEKIFFGLGFDGVFSCKDSFDYAGFQWTAQIQAQIFTDLKAGLVAYQYLGKDTSENNASIGLNIVFAF